MHTRNSQKHNGFTLIELLVSIALLTMIAGLTFFSLSSFNDQLALDRDESSVRAILEKARALTQGAKNDASYGVHFATSTVVLFRGEYSDGDVVEDHELHELVEISDISFDGETDITFTRLIGEPSRAGSTTLRLKNEPSRTRIITVHSTGLVESGE